MRKGERQQRDKEKERAFQLEIAQYKRNGNAGASNATCIRDSERLLLLKTFIDDYLTMFAKTATINNWLETEYVKRVVPQLV